MFKKMSCIYDERQLDRVGQILNDETCSLKQRFRALFTLKNIGGPFALHWMTKCFSDKSELLKHEVAYCIGQMQDPLAIPTLKKILSNTNCETVVRHEAAEALGAIGADCEDFLLTFVGSDVNKEVSDTCELSLARLAWLKENTTTKVENAFNSIDPAPPFIEDDVEELRKILMNDTLDLFQRYRAMFRLRDLASNDSIFTLSEALKSVNNVLMRHELAFVLGQLQNELSVPALLATLGDETENAMVRHECAEALGAIASEEINNVLRKYVEDVSQPMIVRESCIVALDFSDYNANNFEFQYADTLCRQTLI